jgi:uncharacterized protein YndB with AHSA1/START domain
VREPIPVIDRQVVVPVDAAEVWRALTEPERIAEWFTEAIPLAPVGHEYRLDFGDGSVIEGTVEALDPGRSFGYAWHWAGAPPSEVTHVTWSVTATDAEGDGSIIRLVHDGWAEAGLDRSARDDHDGYWAGYLEDLQAVLGARG